MLVAERDVITCRVVYLANLVDLMLVSSYSVHMNAAMEGPYAHLHNCIQCCLVIGYLFLSKNTERALLISHDSTSSA
jgi:hypothetical protein